jgi:hypothetical protein
MKSLGLERYSDPDGRHRDLHNKEIVSFIKILLGSVFNFLICPVIDRSLDS